MRVAIVGGGIAGTALAWRLRRAQPGVEVLLFSASGSAADATAVSGGITRGFEPSPHVCREAVASLVELRASRVLRTWADYREIGSLYLLPQDPSVTALTAVVQAALPGSVEMLQPAEVRRRHGLAGLSPDMAAVWERHAGYLSPARLRRALLADAIRCGVEQQPSTVVAVTDPLGCRLADGSLVRCDAVVVAAGCGTGALLSASGLASWPFRVKRIQYGIYPWPGAPIPAFVDESTGLYGRGTHSGEVLLGVPDNRWDIASQDSLIDRDLEAQVREAAKRRLPGRLGPARRLVVGADSYHVQQGLRLREAARDVPVYTFAGGSGGAAKTVLAASQTAAAQLLKDRWQQSAVPRQRASHVVGRQG